MKRKFLRFPLMATAGLLTFGVVGLSACSTSSVVTAATVKLNATQLNLSVGESAQLKASVSKGYSADLRWFTSNETVAYVNDGYVFAVGEGTAIVTAAFGGGFADCTVIVGESQGGEQVDRLTLSPSSKKIAVGASFQLNYYVYPETATVTFSSGDENIATVSSSGLVSGVAQGKVTITATGSNSKVATCSVEVTAEDSSGTGGDSSDYDIAVDSNLGATGSLTIGSPLSQNTFMKALLADFNTLTNSNVSFTVTTFEEDNGTSGYKDAGSMPAVFPYASDQTLTLYQFQALSSVSKTDYKWIKEQMGDAAYNAARLTSVVGYPFAADNGVVMFYNTDVVKDPSEIDTVTKLFAKADDLDYEVDYGIGTGFYAAGALMTYAGGQSLYTLTPTETSYSSNSTFNSTAGLQAAKLIRSIATQDAIRNAASAPTGDILATITDVSKVQSFKKQLGDKYAVAPLPYVDDAKTTRIGSYLGYKFYGVNNQLTATDKAVAANVAKFLCSEYAQAKRFEQFQVRPTLLSLASLAADEPHIAALALQEASNSTIPLTAISSELWSETAAAVTSIRGLSEDATDNQYKTILAALDSQLLKN